MPTQKKTEKDPWVLQHEHWGTIHFFKNGVKGETKCGNGNKVMNVNTSYSRKRLSKANAHPQAHRCDTPGKCGAV